VFVFGNYITVERRIPIPRKRKKKENKTKAKKQKQKHNMLFKSTKVDAAKNGG
jgi:hypothetical protein